MAIHALPSTAVRILGASQVLNDPVAVVKELLDNSYDAHATSIVVELSSNTLDSIQVRDNGYGIPAQDRELVARPHCTSKISSEEDLKTIGGSSLGFRGEALSSIAELSGSLTISTRVEGEQVATALRINQQGEVEAYERASFPVGTTVKVIDFFKSHPVRRRLVVKNAEKILKNVKTILQGYAIARPHVRLSLRVLKAKTAIGDWTYAPKIVGNAEDAAYKIFGTGCASQCLWSIVEDDAGLILQAFLPKPDADMRKVHNVGTFISVDARPVSASKGIPKQIRKIFQEALMKAILFDGVTEPFLYLEISCPSGSYDANIEPAKNDVLFEEPDAVLKAARRLFETVYASGEVSRFDPFADPVLATNYSKVAAVGETQVGKMDRVEGDSEVETAMELSKHGGHLPGIDGHQTEINPPSMSRKFRSNMYGCDEEDIDLIDACPPTGRSEGDIEELRETRKDIKLSNPWVIAKLNAPARRLVTMQENENLRVDAGGPGDARRPTIDLQTPGLPTPRPSSPLPMQSSFHPEDHVDRGRLAGDGRMIGSQALPQPRMQLTPQLGQRASVGIEEGVSRQQLGPLLGYEYMSPCNSGTPLADIPRAPSKRRYLQQATYSAPRPGRKSLRPSRDTAGLVVQGKVGDPADFPRPLTPPTRNRDIRDFVTSLDLTTNDSTASLTGFRNSPQQRSRSVDNSVAQVLEYPGGMAPSQAPNGVLGINGFIPASELAALGAHIQSLDNPTKRTKLSESRTRREIDFNAAVTSQDKLDEFQPGGMSCTVSRRHSAVVGSKVRRRKTSQLPLERTPTNQLVQNLIVSISTSEQGVARLAGKIDEEYSIDPWNDSAGCQHDTFATASTSEMLQELPDKLRRLLMDRVSDGEMVQDLNKAIRDAFNAHARGSSEAVYD